MAAASRSSSNGKSLLMFGNNFGLFGSPKRLKWLLKKFYGMTSKGARIIAESADPYKTDDPFHFEYHKFNWRRGRMPGQLRIRVRYKKYATPWFDYLIVSKNEMRRLLRGTGWKVKRFIESKRSRGPAYIAVSGKEIS